jgi:hypothetical protein
MEITENKFKTNEEVHHSEVPEKALSYDPKKAYKWEPSDQITITGSEFGVLLNSIRAVLNTPEAQRILTIERANLAIESVIKRSVESGIVKEDPNQR